MYIPKFKVLFIHSKLKIANRPQFCISKISLILSLSYMLVKHGFEGVSTLFNVYEGYSNCIFFVKKLLLVTF